MTQNETTQANSGGLLQTLGPGILVAATGVGAGDLAGGALAGRNLGTGVLWIVLVGAALRFVLCEGLARWQLRSGLTVPDGATECFGNWFRIGFLCYLAVWCFCIGGMLMSACGVAAHALIPLGTADTGRITWGIGHSLAAVALVLIGGFAWFERIMTVCIGIMFFTVIIAAIGCVDSLPAVATGLLVPKIPFGQPRGVEWSLTLLAGVGGTVTMLCYGYWIREKGRLDSTALRACRVDLATGYLMTAVFGIGMVILGAALVSGEDTARGVNLIVGLSTRISERLGGTAGTVAGWMFRVGAWGAVFSSLLGVWQSIPLLLLDVYDGRSSASSIVDPGRNRKAVCLLILLATIPAVNLLYSLSTVQLVAGVSGAVFLPIFALTLLAFGWKQMAGFRNGRLAVLALWFCLLLFAGYLILRLYDAVMWLTAVM